MKPVIAVSGKDGQLGWELEQMAAAYPQFDFQFCDRQRLDITNETAVAAFFEQYQPSVFINCAAYTAVDKAETEQETAYLVNAAAVGNLARQCSLNDSLFITFSTDYVFDGSSAAPYPEKHPTAPVNYYGYTKEQGEKLALFNWYKTIIIRTSWVYSSHGHNFVKTMLRLMGERSQLNVVNDQVGAPTFARDLAAAVMEIVSASEKHYGIFHFSNDGRISWFEFASAIRDLAGLSCEVLPIPSSGFPTPAKRPAFSLLENSGIVKAYGVRLKNWRESLESCIRLLK